jgi:DNA-binding Lrp family transcriptional regulator
MAERKEELWMSAKDRDRLKVLHAVRKRHITQVQAGEELGISARWVRVLLKRMKREGDRAVVHRLRGRPSNRKLPGAMKQRVLAVFRERKQAKQWHDYGPTLAVEELGAEHQLQVSKETLRQWLLEAGLWRAAEPGWNRCTLGGARSALGRVITVGQ